MLINLTKHPVQLLKTDGTTTLLMPSPQHTIFNKVRKTTIHDPNGYVLTLPTSFYRNNINSTVIVDADIMAMSYFKCNVILANKLLFGVYTEASYVKVCTSEELAREKTAEVTGSLLSLVDACSAFGHDVRRRLAVEKCTPKEIDLVIQTTIKKIDAGDTEILMNYLKDKTYVNDYLREILNGGVK